MKRIVPLLFIIAGIVYGLHFSKKSYEEHEASGHAGVQAMHDMNHGTHEVTNEGPLPSITDLSVLKDPMSGWNITFKTVNFLINPANASKTHTPGEGHAHLYVNNQKVARLYGYHYHLPELTSSINHIKITLNTNDHQTLTANGVPIERTTTIKNQ